MNKYTIRIGETVDEHKPVYLDLHKLVDTRALFEASSGQGKSTLIRLIAERAAGLVQTIILDHEDEFPTLRTVADVLLVGDGRDLPIAVATASLLARRLAELQISAVINLYDLDLDARREYVGVFLSELLNTPKPLWHPMLIMLDEAHIYCPEKGDVPSRKPVVNMMSQGRKREYAELVATQRFSKIDKDAIADAKNVFIGGTWLDLDQKRAGDMLGLKSAEYTALRDLVPGEWYAFGQALVTADRGVVHFIADAPASGKPQSGRKSFAVPKASDMVQSLLEQIGDLPAQAQEEKDVLGAAQREANDLRQKLAQKERELLARPVQMRVAPPEVKVEYIERPVLNGQLPRLEAALERLDELLTPFPTRIGEVLSPITDELRSVKTALLQVKSAPPRAMSVSTPRVLPVSIPTAADAHAVREIGEGDTAITAPQQRILDALATLESLGIAIIEKSNVAVFAGQSPSSSGYTNNLGRLRTLQLVTYPAPGKLALTEEGRARANPVVRIESLDDLHNAWYGKLSRPKAAILKEVIADYPHPVEKTDLAARAGQSATSSGYTNNLGSLRSLGVIDYPQPGYVVATTLLFPEGLM